MFDWPGRLRVTAHLVAHFSEPLAVRHRAFGVKRVNVGLARSHTRHARHGSLGRSPSVSRWP